MRYLLVGAVIGFVTYGQLIIKYRINRLGPAPGRDEVPMYLLRALTDVGILSGLAAAVLAALAWLLTLSRFELSSAYPLLAINFLLVPLLSIPLFGERMNLAKGVGLAIVVAGLAIFAAGIEAGGTLPGSPGGP